MVCVWEAGVLSVDKNVKCRSGRCEDDCLIMNALLRKRIRVRLTMLGGIGISG